MVGSRISGKALLVPVDRPGQRHARTGRHQLAHDSAVGAIAAQHDDGADAALQQQARGGKVSSTVEVGSKSRNSMAGSR
jgi:hypothetical protein